MGTTTPNDTRFCSPFMARNLALLNTMNWIPMETITSGGIWLLINDENSGGSFPR
jgi:hypothetical protein